MLDKENRLDKSSLFPAEIEFDHILKKKKKSKAQF